MRVSSFRFDRALARDFAAFGRTLYRQDTLQIPPFRRTLSRQLSPDYPFYNKPGNDHCHFLVHDGPAVVGRVSAMVNAALRDEDGTPVGLVGFFECIEDPVVATVLLDSACDWLRGEHGLTRIWGPMNFDIWHSYRFMTKGFDEEPFYSEPSNKPWYPDYFQRYGFRPRRTWNSLEIQGRPELESLVAGGREAYVALLDRGYRFVSGETWDHRKDMRPLHELFSRCFSGFLGYTPIEFEDFNRLYGRQRFILARPMSFFVHDPADRPVAFAVTFYELSAAIRAMHGRENPVSQARFLIGRRSVQRLNLYAAGAVPEEQGRGIGLSKAGLYHVVDQALQHGFEDIIFALMATGNRVQGLFRRAPHAAQREYALYELSRAG
jgi:hypothetical protein